MPRNQFIQGIEDLLEDEENTIDFVKISPKYAAVNTNTTLVAN